MLVIPALGHLEGQGKNDYHEFQASLDCTNNETLSQKLANVGERTITGKGHPAAI